MSPIQRREYQLTIIILRPYIIRALEALGKYGCQTCGTEKERLELHHRRYAEDVTLYDLELLCVECHRVKTRIAREERKVALI